MALSESIDAVRNDLTAEEQVEFDALLNSITDTSGYERRMKEIKVDATHHLDQIYTDAAENIEAAFQNQAIEITNLFN